MNREETKVKRYKCLCGKTRMLSVMDGSLPSKDEIKVMKVCPMDVISLDEARTQEFCFDCKLPKSNQ